jgi:tripartite-type tricarboxylate transporter receptor subunit TctC
MKRCVAYAVRAIVAALAATAGCAMAQAWPAKPIRFIIPWPPGGGADVLARLLAPKMSESLGRNFIMENRPGAAGNIGTEVAARAPGDGYTIVFAYSGTHAINPFLYRQMPFKASDFVSISWLSQVPQVVVVHPTLPVKSIKDLIALARARPEQVTYASSGNGAVNHLAGELMNMMAGVKMVHIPYKGGAAASFAVLSGESTVILGEPAGVVPHISAGKLRAIAVTSGRRSLGMPDLPTVIETGLPGYDVTSWNGVLAPAGTAPEIISRLNAEFVRAVRAPDLRDKLLAQGFEPVGSTPEEFTEHIRSESVKWGKVVRATGMKVD